MTQKINNIPVVNWLRKKHIPDYADILLVNVPDKDKGNKQLKKQINDIMNLDDVPLSIRIITEPFLKAMKDAMPNFTKDIKIWTSLGDNVQYSGVLFLSEVIYYRFVKRPEANDYDIFIAVFDKMTTLLYFYRQVSGHKAHFYISVLQIARMKQLISHLREASEEEIRSTINAYYYRIVVLFELFRKYGQVEMKVLQPKMKADLFKCKYHNQSDYTFEIMDSTWFTTLVKSDEFKVRGHFRLQPHGEGFKDRKLIWIKDFKKEGYTRRAKKELQTA